jgi:hypothetical protein
MKTFFIMDIAQNVPEFWNTVNTVDVLSTGSYQKDTPVSVTYFSMFAESQGMLLGTSMRARSRDSGDVMQQ